MNHNVNHVNALGRSFNPTHHLFQSAPLTEARGDPEVKADELWKIGLFQLPDSFF